MKKILSLACWLTAATLVCAESPQTVQVDGIKDKVHIGLEQQLRLRFTLDGDRLLAPERVLRTGDDKAIVGVKLHVTDSTPFRVRGVATRPYLVVSNGFGRTLHFRAAARHKGSKGFFELIDAGGPVDSGGESLKCWESGSLVEEVVLYQFTLSARPAK